MITSFIINLGLGFVELIFSIFPESTGLSSTVVTQLEGLGEYIGLINAIYPLEPFFAMLAIVFATDGLIWTYRFIRQLTSHVPVVGGSGK